MNSSRLQRLILSMLHDPSFRSRLEAQPTYFQARYSCTQSEIEHVLSFDPRLFRADPLRADRLLTGLLNLYPVSVWSIFEEGVFVTLRRFFATDLFHDVIWERGLVHQGFAQYITEFFPTAQPYVELERAIEDSRTVRRATTRGAYEYELSPSVYLLKMKTGYLDSFLSSRALIADASMSGAAFLLERPSKLPKAVIDDATEYILIEGSTEPSVGGISTSLAKVLMYVQTPRSYEQLVSQLVREGADKSECSDLIQEFLTNRWIEGQVFSPEC